MGLGIFGGEELNKISREANGITGVNSNAYLKKIAIKH
jgi:hypothetical protein